jgi:hypothetical protein
MVHVLAPRPPKPFLPIFWNVDTSVGKNAANSTVEDILLVQFFISLIVKNPLGSTPPGLRPVSVTGRINPETIAAIEVLQRASGLTPDGRISVAHGYEYGGKGWTIVHMNNAVNARFQTRWPNLDELPECPALLNLAGRRALGGVRP